MTPTTKSTTTCRICQQPFNHQPLEIPVIGQPVTQAAVKIVMALGEHLHKKHRGQMDVISISIQDFTGLAILDHFETTDEGLKKRLNGIRYHLHKQTRLHTVTDEGIATMVDALQVEDELRDVIEQMLRGVRDAYEETGAFSPDELAKSESRIIQPESRLSV